MARVRLRPVTKAVVMIMLSGLVLAACNENPPAPTVGDEAADLIGHFRYQGETGLFRVCGSKDEYPVTSEGDAATLERAYAEAATKTGDAVLVRLEANLTWQPTVDTLGKLDGSKERAWYVERFVGLEDGDDCPSLKDE